MDTFYQPATLFEALAIKKEQPRAVFLAGGTDLCVQSRKTGPPEMVIDLGRIEGLRELHWNNGVYHIGAAVTFAALTRHPISGAIPALKKALLVIGSQQIRNRGTVGGNLCTASPAADLTPLWVVLGTQMELARLDKDGTIQTRKMPVQDFITAAGKTRLCKDEMMTGLSFVSPIGTVGYEKIARRNALAISRLNAALYLQRNGDFIQQARICIGAVTDRPIRAEKAEQYIEGKPFDGIDIDTVAKNCVAAYFDIGHWRKSYAYKLPVVKKIVAALLLQAMEGSVEGEATD